jgi:putative DNA primase/helicase
MFTDGMAEQQQHIVKLASETAQAAKLRAMISLAESEPGIPIDVDDLNPNGSLLNCPNGTLDLRTGKLRQHERWQNITMLCPTEYREDATCPQWEQFLKEVCVDEDLIAFVQRLLGYCLTADVSEQKLPIFYGTGANGKSTLLNAFLDVVGTDYTMQAMPDFLMEKRGESHPTEKAALFGKRFVSCVETESSRKLAESTVKMLTGGERIQARRMREDFWEFQPSHKLVLCTNHKPIVAGTDHGIWRRVLLVPFSQRFEGSRIDKKLPEKLKAEAVGILAWLVEGCLKWQRFGFNPPESVTSATDEYRSQEDIIGRFVSERCQRAKSSAVRFSNLYTAFESWCKDTGDFCPSKRKMGSWLTDQGYQSYSAHGRMYRGLVLKADGE